MRRAQLVVLVLLLTRGEAPAQDLLNGTLAATDPTAQTLHWTGVIEQLKKERDELLTLHLHPAKRIYDNLPTELRRQHRSFERGMIQAYWHRGQVNDAIRAFELIESGSVFRLEADHDPCGKVAAVCEKRRLPEPEVRQEMRALFEWMRLTPPGEDLAPVRFTAHMQLQEALKAPFVGLGAVRLEPPSADRELVRRRLHRHFRWGRFKDEALWRDKIERFRTRMAERSFAMTLLMERIREMQVRTTERIVQLPRDAPIRLRNKFYEAVRSSEWQNPHIEAAIELIVQGEVIVSRIARGELTPSGAPARNHMAGLALVLAGAAAAYVEAPDRATLMRLGAVGVIGTPLLLDTSGNGRPDVHPRATPGTTVPFDLDGDGLVESVAWLTGRGDALLARDLDSDGAITSGRELFGWANGHEDGFAALAAACDRDGDGWVRGRELDGLLLWRDDGDGLSRPEELEAAAAAGIEAIACRHRSFAATYVVRGRTRSMWDWMPEVRTPCSLQFPSAP